MTALFLALLLVGGLVSFFALRKHRIRKKEHQRKRSLYERFSRLGDRKALNFTSQEALNDLLLGVDGRKGKLLVLKTSRNTVYHSFVIDLKEVRHCFVQRRPGAAGNEDENMPTACPAIETVSLCFEFSGEKPPREICFYHHRNNALAEYRERLQKAVNWQVMLLKLSTTANGMV